MTARAQSEMLSLLISQAESAGGDLVTIRALIEEASDMGAARALERLGLADGHAETDLRELRELLGAWRDAKRSLVKAIIGWLARLAAALLLLGLAVKLDLLRLPR